VDVLVSVRTSTPAAPVGAAAAASLAGKHPWQGRPALSPAAAGSLGGVGEVGVCAPSTFPHDHSHPPGQSSLPQQPGWQAVRGQGPGVSFTHGHLCQSGSPPRLRGPLATGWAGGPRRDTLGLTFSSGGARCWPPPGPAENQQRGFFVFFAEADHHKQMHECMRPRGIHCA